MIFVSILPVLLSCVAASNLQILSAHDNLGPEPCAKTCVGTTTEAATTWEQDHVALSAGHYVIKTTVDISGCGFVSTPIVITSSHTGGIASSSHPYIGASTSGQSNVVDLTNDSFTIYLFGFHGKVFEHIPFTIAFGGFWDIHWAAFGFIC